MIHYHGGPVTPDTCAIRAWRARHAFISFANPTQVGLASEICQSFSLDNGAFPNWQKQLKGQLPKDFRWVEFWLAYYEWIKRWMNHPRFDFAIIPDQIGGGEEENDKLIDEWPFGTVGVPVWHMDESDERLIRLANTWPRVAIGSCGEYDVKHPRRCVEKLKDVLSHIVDDNGYPICKLHGLRMLNPAVFRHVPLASADSTNVARNIGIDKSWKGPYSPHSKETRASVMVERIESNNSASRLLKENVEATALQLGFVF
ncbi:hypothetical protein [Vibrio alginolyticus]|uniref:hypothetical protein n=1 Tax=Vibrio alginolyticus TaxID=663 RepID=UPI001C9CF6BD|nr:hypothetical protein [Vibrio alginolyticus]MBY7685781.1 hypothetical protein [Vibrio alginolyticus]